MAFTILLVLVIAYIVWRELAIPAIGGVEVQLGRVLRIAGAADSEGLAAANGYIVARKRAALSTDIPGQIVELAVEEGDRIRKGDLVARIDARQLEASRARARAEVARAEAEERLANLELGRKNKLAETNDASPSEVDMAKAEHDQALARIESAKATVREIDETIRKCSVYAPFDGIIVEKNAEVGEVVSATGGTGPNARGAVATIVATETLEVQVELAQRSLQVAQIGAPVQIVFDAYPDDGYRGRVRQIWPIADRQKATVELRVEFLERDDRILPELGVRVVFLRGDEPEIDEPRILVPRRALAQGTDSVVFLFEDGTVSLRKIALTGEEEHGQLLVASGLSGHELVVLDPPSTLKDGDSVTTRDDFEKTEESNP